MAYGLAGKLVIVRETSEDEFVQKAHDLVVEGYRPANTLETFAEWDEDEKAWQTLYVMAFFRDTGEDVVSGEGGEMEIRQMFS